MFNSTGGYGNALLPGVLILILQQTLLLGIGLAAGTARENNRYKDLVPISKHYNGIFRIVLGKSMCYFMIYCVMAAYITLCVPRFFHFTSLVHASSLVCLMIPYLLSCIFFGMTISCVVRYRENVLLLVVFTSVPFLFMSGISWPASNIPAFWKRRWEPHSINIRNQRIPENQQHGSHNTRHGGRIQGTVDSDRMLFLHCLHGLQGTNNSSPETRYRAARAAEEEIRRGIILPVNDCCSPERFSSCRVLYSVCSQR